MIVKKFVFNPFQENTFIVSDTESKECAIVDAGCYSIEEKMAIKTYITENSLKLKYAINTHCHADHVLGMAFIKDEFNAKILIGEADKFLYDNAAEHGAVFALKVGSLPEIDGFIKAGDKIKLGNSELEIMHAPGHSPGSLVFYSTSDNFAIVGDVLFDGSIGRTDLPGGDFDTLIKSIKENLFTLADETTIYCGHGNETTIAKEKSSNPFLQ